MPGGQCRARCNRVTSYRWRLTHGLLLGVGREGVLGPLGWKSKELGGWLGVHVDRALSTGARPLTLAPSVLSHNLLPLRGPGLGQGKAGG